MSIELYSDYGWTDDEMFRCMPKRKIAGTVYSYYDLYQSRSVIVVAVNETPDHRQQVTQVRYASIPAETDVVMESSGKKPNIQHFPIFCASKEQLAMLDSQLQAQFSNADWIYYYPKWQLQLYNEAVYLIKPFTQEKDMEEFVLDSTHDASEFRAVNYPSKDASRVLYFAQVRMEWQEIDKHKLLLTMEKSPDDLEKLFDANSDAPDVALKQWSEAVKRNYDSLMDNLIAHEERAMKQTAEYQEAVERGDKQKIDELMQVAKGYAEMTFSDLMHEM